MQVTVKAVAVDQNDAAYLTEGNVYTSVRVSEDQHIWLITDTNKLHQAVSYLGDTAHWQLLAVNGVPVSGYQG